MEAWLFRRSDCRGRMKRSSLLCLAVATAIAGGLLLVITTSSGRARQAPSMALPAPADRPCTFPSTRSVLAKTIEAADVVVAGTSVRQELNTSSAGIVSKYSFVISETLLGSQSMPAITISMAGGRPRAFLESGHQYVLFLKRSGDEGAYFVVDGSAGRFELRQSRLYLFCPDYSAGDLEPANGSQGMELAEFRAMVTSPDSAA